jgi:tetratricopeptide (TPR) repeat protein
MKVNRQPAPEITEEMVARDHQFWKDYSQRLIGDWINYDTSPKEICEFCEKVYVRHDYSGFKGDPKFVRDEDAQKSFSKLRNAIGASIYQWRAGMVPMSPTPPPASPAVHDRMVREAEFAMKQSFAFCPYSPEAVYHLMILYYNQGRLEDLRLVLKTAQALDPHSGQFNEWLSEVESHLASQKVMTEKQTLARAQQLVQAGNAAEAETTLDKLTQDPHTDLNTLLQAAVAYVQLGKPAKGAAVSRKLTDTYPNAWEIWFYLARMEALDGKAAESAAALEKSFAINSSDLVSNANQPPTRFHDFVRDDKSFDAIRQTPEFQKAMQTNK